MEHNKEVVDRLVTENLSGKLDTYIQRLDWEDVEGEISLVLEQNKTERFNGTLHVKIDGKSYHYSREDYKNLDDLINHLFDHLKEDLSQK